MSDELAFIAQQTTEFEAWRALMQELAKRGVDDINEGGKDEALHDTLVAWAEELCELRRLDPNPEHGQNALAERRAKIDANNEADS